MSNERLALGQIKARLGKVKRDGFYKQRGLRLVREALEANRSDDYEMLETLRLEAAKMLTYAQEVERMLK